MTANYDPHVNNSDNNNITDHNSDDHDGNNTIEDNTSIIKTPLDCGDGGESRRLALIARTQGAFGVTGVNGKRVLALSLSLLSLLL